MEMKPYYILLHRALVNVGDFLIGARTKELLEAVRPDRTIIVGEAWRPLDLQFDLDVINNAKAIIIAGGPGYVNHMYPDIYPLMSNLEKLEAPLTYLAGGFNSVPAPIEIIYKFRFSDGSRQLLDKMTDQGRKIGTRGFMTKQVLDYNGYPQAVMVGDPAWYHLPSLGQEFIPPKHLRTIVFTPPANKPYFDQAKQILAYIVKEFSNCSSSSEVIVSFHRGIDADFARFAESQNCKVVDVSGNISHLQFYDSCDLHVGYRLHAHLYFLSLRKPSYVIAEDFRALESLNTLASFGFSGWYVDRIHSESGTQQWNAYLAPSLPKILVEQIVNDRRTRFSRFAGLGTTIDSFYHSSMKPFLEQLP